MYAGSNPAVPTSLNGDVMQFKDVKVTQIFFEDSTGEYYIKMDSVYAWVFDINKNLIYRNSDGVIECEFPFTREVELVVMP